LPMSVLSEAEKKVFADRTAVGRWGDPRELVGPALLLSSDAGSYITGQTFVVDGGFLAR
jgi:NAD(P)-dependent dehydrogenase (short-subunit alcohol dehydrogenase family)